MISEARWQLLATVALGLGLGLVLACGSDESSAPDPTPVPAERAAAVEPKAQPSVVLPTIPSPLRETISAELAAKIEIPDFYPEDGPVYPGTLPSKSFVNGNVVNLMFGTSDSPDQVLEFMNKEFPRLGWENAAVMRMSNVISIEATKPGRSLAVILTEVASGSPEQTTLIAISITGA
jgi:hypothetical protein